MMIEQQHPLTDKKCISLFSFERLMDESRPFTIEDAMRTAADWQLQQVIEWLKSNLNCSIYLQPDDSCPYLSMYEIDVDDVLKDLKDVMRPQQQEHN